MDAAALQTQTQLLQQQVALLQETPLLRQSLNHPQALEESRIENTLLRQKLDALARRLFGKKSEHLGRRSTATAPVRAHATGLEPAPQNLSRPWRLRAAHAKHRNVSSPRRTWKWCAK